MRKTFHVTFYIEKSYILHRKNLTSYILGKKILQLKPEKSYILDQKYLTYYIIHLT